MSPMPFPMAQPHGDIEYSGENRNLCHSDTKGVYVIIQRSVDLLLLVCGPPSRLPTHSQHRLQ
jgi:hypothetical protein